MLTYIWMLINVIVQALEWQQLTKEEQDARIQAIINADPEMEIYIIITKGEYNGKISYTGIIAQVTIRFTSNQYIYSCVYHEGFFSSKDASTRP